MYVPMGTKRERPEGRVVGPSDIPVGIEHGRPADEWWDLDGMGAPPEAKEPWMSRRQDKDRWRAFAGFPRDVHSHGGHLLRIHSLPILHGRVLFPTAFVVRRLSQGVGACFVGWLQRRIRCRLRGLLAMSVQKWMPFLCSVVAYGTDSFEMHHGIGAVGVFDEQMAESGYMVIS